MTEKTAKSILEKYQETDEDTGEKYGYKVLESLGPDGRGFVFRCRADGADEDCILGVYPDSGDPAGGTVLCIPQ